MFYKRSITLYLIIISILFTGCSSFFSSEEEKNSIKIGISMYDEYDAFLSELCTYMIEKSKELESEKGVYISVDIVSAGGNQITQNDQIERFVDKNYDVLCVNLVDRTDASTIIEKAKSADIPIIFINRELVAEDLNRWDKLYYVGAIARQAGEMQGEIIVNACQERFQQIDTTGDRILQYVILEGEAGHQDALMRTQYSVSTILEGGYDVQKLGSEIANWNRAQAETKMTSLIERYSSLIEVVIANDDNMAMGIIDALKSQKMVNWPIIVGVNGSLEVLEMIRTKRMEGTVWNDSKGQASAIIRMAYALARNEEFPEDIIVQDGKYVYLPYQIITYNNVQQYIDMKTKE